MYAMIETGGKQYKVSSGESIKVERLGAGQGAEVKFEKVLAVVKDGGAVFGTPYISGASVSAEVLGEVKADKVIAYKQRPRKVFRKIRGHRQKHTVVKIKEITGV